MGDESKVEWRQLTGKAQDMSRVASNEFLVMARAATTEASSWDIFKWTAIALLCANLLLAVLLYGKIRDDLAELQAGRSGSGEDLADIRATMAKQIADTKAEITLDISTMRTGLQEEVTKVNARLDDLTQSAPSAPTSTMPPKPMAKPGRGR
jgi:hypothetical protein